LVVERWSYGRMSWDLARRSAREVFDDHLDARRRGIWKRTCPGTTRRTWSCSPPEGVLHGHDGVRESAGLQYQAIRHADHYVYENVQCEERMALLEWRAEGRTSAIRDGVDSYLIEAGRIVGQTIDYTVISRELSVADLANPSHQAEEAKD
jgi:hypothetical protein